MRGIGLKLHASRSSACRYAIRACVHGRYPSRRPPPLSRSARSAKGRCVAAAAWYGVCSTGLKPPCAGFWNQEEESLATQTAPEEKPDEASLRQLRSGRSHLPDRPTAAEGVSAVSRNRDLESVHDLLGLAFSKRERLIHFPPSARAEVPARGGSVIQWGGNDAPAPGGTARNSMVIEPRVTHAASTLHQVLLF